MKYEILLNKILRLPTHKAIKVLEEYENNEQFKSFADQQRVMDILTQKINVRKQIKKEVIEESFMCLALMVKSRSPFSKIAFEKMKDYPMIIWIETIGQLDSENIMALLNNYCKEFPSSLIETCIINLPDNLQLLAIDKYNRFIKVEDKMFYSFYYSVSEEARLKLKKIFKHIEDDILLELEDLEEKELIKRLEKEQDRLSKVSADELVQFILLNSNELSTLTKFFSLYSDKINKCSIPRFELLITRYKYLRDSYLQNEIFLSNIELVKLFKDKFHQIGIEETLKLFDDKVVYKVNEFTVDIVLEFLDIAYSNMDLSKYINDETLIEIINRFQEKCNNKDYTLEEFETLVKNIGKSDKTKLIFDDYIEAIIACGKLLKNNIINDKNPLFLELREKFSNELLNRVKKDGTYTKDISLNGVFYRLTKGTFPFAKLYTTKTYKGLIYLTKAGKLIDNADYITSFLTDEQVAKLNINPIIKWKNIINRNNTRTDNLSFIERMGLQLLLYFGRDKAKYLLESDMQGNRMEYLFDGLKYADISVNEDGTSNINEELVNYLFGYGLLRDDNSIINKMINRSIPEFEKYFTEFCNSFSEVKKACNGILTTKRIIKHFEDIELPIKLNPDELQFKQALLEMNTTNVDLLKKAIELCKDARRRTYSSIPQVEGELGDFTYKILDLNDPMAVAVGYLSHCCFVVDGISHLSLKHSMQSKNGRTFVVYYKGQFLTQSWVWRNGDVICFDSVEAGSPIHGMYKDDIKLVDVYKKAANDIFNISKENEDIQERVKVVTVGKSDYAFDKLEYVQGDVAMPLENDVYVYDSNVQQILTGNMPENPRYGTVRMQYKDKRKKVVSIKNKNSVNADILDEVIFNINSLRYQVNGEKNPINIDDYSNIISGDGWYILINKKGAMENGIAKFDDETIDEYNEYLSKYNNSNLNIFESNIPGIKKLMLTNKKDRS